jgi:uncharacterized protein
MEDQKSGAIAIFVKTPEFSEVKTRLAKGIGKENAIQFHLSSAKAVAAIAKSTHRKVFFAVAEKAAQDSKHWKEFPTCLQGEGSLGHRMGNVYATLLKSNNFVILLGADSPQIRPEDLVMGMAWLEDSSESRFIFGPARDGGFWIFGGNENIPETIWTSVEYSREDTGKNFLKKIETLGEVFILPEYQDIDTEEDLEPVIIEMEKQKSLLKEQVNLVNLARKFIEH